MSKILYLKDFNEIKIKSEKAFKDLGSESYKQKLVYKLLALIKGENQHEFFNVLLRTLNNNDSEYIKNLTQKLNEIYPLNKEDYENVAYAIVMGIMAS